MTAITWFYLILAAVGAAAVILPRWSARQGDTGLVQFQLISMATIGFVAGCVLAEVTHSLSDAYSLPGALVAFTLATSLDCGHILWRNRRGQALACRA